MTTLKAKPLLEGKFWLVSENDENVGTICKEDDRFVYQCHTGTQFFDNEGAMSKSLGKIVWSSKEIEDEKVEVENEAYGFCTSTAPSNSVYDIKRKLPLFTKSEKSKSLYCAGYYIIHFPRGWVKSFCPKFVTLKEYEYQGPFKTAEEMKERLKAENRKSKNA